MRKLDRLYKPPVDTSQQCGIQRCRTHSLTPIKMLWCLPSCVLVRTSSLTSFSRMKPCTSRFAVLCRWPTITPGFWCGDFPLAAQMLNADQDLPSSAVQALQECDDEFFPNVQRLLRILCTLPISSAECERSFSTMRRLKTLYLRSTMTSEQESGLALMNIHYNRQIDVSANIDIFCTEASTAPPSCRYPSEWTVNLKTTVFDEVCNVFNNY